MQNSESMPTANTIFHAQQCSAYSERVAFTPQAPDGDSIASVAPGDWLAYHRNNFV